MATRLEWEDGQHQKNHISDRGAFLSVREFLQVA